MSHLGPVIPQRNAYLIQLGLAGIAAYLPRKLPDGRYAGYRCWRWGFHSLSARYQWLPGLNETVCLCDGRLSRATCPCGFYAFWTPYGLLGELSNVPLRQLMLGEIAAWGRVQVHARGFRAERAEVTRLFTLGLEPYDRELKWEARRRGLATVPIESVLEG